VKKVSHPWAFRTRFRARGFGWKSQPAIAALKTAVDEIAREAKRDPMLGAEGAVLLLERISPAFEKIDSSSGAIGNAVWQAISVLVPLIAGAPAERAVREHWLDRLFRAHEADRIPYIETLGEYWGELCVTPELASAQAEALLGLTRRALSPTRRPGEFFHGTTMCLSALLRAGRYDELLALVEGDRLIWSYKRFGAMALAARGKTDEAIAYAEAARGLNGPLPDVMRVCEEALLSAGRVDEAYRRYGLFTHTASTYVGTLRAIAKKYPHLTPTEILRDLVRASAGAEGKWFAAAKDLGLYAEALDLAARSPCEPKTLTRAARDHATKQPEFALGSGLLALRWLASGHGYEIEASDVWAAYRVTLEVAEKLGRVEQTQQQIRALFAGSPGSFAGKVLERELEGSPSAPTRLH
jgi:tetratricopeptide (TPR) repeat protein